MAIIDGTNNPDFLEGTLEADLIRAFGGLDNIQSSAGADTIDGGTGEDRVEYDNSNAGVTVVLADGTGSGSGAGGFAEGDVLIGIENVTGSAFSDTIFGNSGDNFIDGFGGSDHLKGGGGDDGLRGSGTLEGGSGDDALRGGLGADTLLGGADDDRLDGREGADLIDGGDGIDTVVYEGSQSGVVVTFVDSDPENGGFAEGDRLLGIENLIGSSLTDFLIGNGTVNQFDGGAGDDVLIGNGGADTLEGGLDNDTLTGGTGDDLLLGGFGADRHEGGTGKDRVHYLDSLEGVTVDLQVNFGVGGHAEGDTWSSIEVVDGSIFADQITGDGAANDIFGGLGNDTLKGGGGNDTLLGSFDDDLLRGNDGQDFLDGGEGADRMIGDAGNDTYIFFDSGDVIDELGGTGIDAVRSSVSFSLTGSAVRGDVENVTLTGAANINASGNDLANVLQGNAGANRLLGEGGADTMIGGNGNDRYTVLDAGDIVDEGGTNGIDEIGSAISIALGGPQVKGTVENVVLLGQSNINADGNAVANSLVGNGGINVLNGGAGNDLLRGAGGGDFFVFATALTTTTNVDTISDFNVLQDTIRLENAVFTGLVNGELAASAFHIGAAAADASHRILYDADTGTLSFDADGAGGAAAVRFATLDDDLEMTNQDFFVI
jgi:Ca2+-binding RTX toxin-like protein